jgi:hypothetical protein
MFDKKTERGKDTSLIKVYPSKNAVLLGVEKTDRRKSEMTDVLEGIFGIGAFARILYYQQWQVVYEGQTISLFGKLKYDLENGTFNFDEVIGMYRGDKQHEMLDTFKTRRFEDVLAIFGWGVLLGLSAWAVFKITKFVKRAVQDHLRAQR